MSPYRLPVINNYVTPVPPPPRKREKNGTLRGRRLRPTTAPNGPATLLAKDTPKPHRSFSHSNVLITMVYRGKRLHLCIIAMGLDKKPIPPPKRMKEEVVKEINKDKLELTKDKEKLTVLNASKETSQEETMSADSSVEEEKVKEAEEMHEDEGESSPTTETQGGLPRSPASFRSSSYSPRSSEDSDAERPEGDVTDDEEEHKIIVVKDGGDPATARTPGVAPGKATPDSGEVTAVNNEAGEDEKVTERGVLLEGAEGAEEEIVQAPVREDQSPQGVGGDTEEKAVTDKEIESRVEANDKPEKNNKEVVETGGEALITVDIHDIHSKDVALRGSEVNISATELSVLGRSVGE
ncbi:hypothetical protein scyTo_0019778 [Scyliorhinus torazame]|uniref:Uncharacterized protein n=1 Tax=Scyliorhinus torazame TaxID=75743 RepID=A0A401PQY6_SCYTO|nr:hypothetical protein [Scyliorhinus torazame]